MALNDFQPYCCSGLEIVQGHTLEKGRAVFIARPFPADDRA